MPSRREFLAFLAPGAATANVWAQTKRPPNVVLVMTDDQGSPDLGVHGNTQLRTPHIDRLAKQSVEFTNFLVAPLCAPKIGRAHV